MFKGVDLAPYATELRHLARRAHRVLSRAKGRSTTIYERFRPCYNRSLTSGKPFNPIARPTFSAG
jgi:hypothetical protein